MMTVSEIQSWLDKLQPGDEVAIDEGGLALTAHGGEAWLEIGGEPEEKAE